MTAPPQVTDVNLREAEELFRAAEDDETKINDPSLPNAKNGIPSSVLES